jgi:hypothetical protein
MISKYFLYTFLFFFSSLLHAQSFGAEASASLGMKPAGSILLNGSIDLGHSFNDLDYLHGGLMMSWFPYGNFGADELEDTGIMTFNLYTGYRHLIPLFTTQYTEKRIGVFPEVRGMFNPYIPRMIRYQDNDELIKVKGDYAAQLSFSLGFGVFVEPKDAGEYWAIKFQYMSMDPFKTLRTLNSPYSSSYPGSSQFAIVLSYFHW